ncbi:MAG: hypothetical protein JW955_15980 [Sedimentisphaerales bacterium]|nr:hypothetical protein [Sedimentisphaerales bacterium]
MVARRSFYATEFGTLAVLPRAWSRATANTTGTFLTVESETLCTVKPTRNPVWFQFNHHFSESDGKRCHLGALILVLGKHAGERQIELFRNAKWTRPNSSEILGEFSASPDLSWGQFVALTRESISPQADVRKVDEAFGGPWHGIPCGGDKYSWSYRKFWNWAVSTYETTRQGAMQNAARIDHFRVSARLIAYQPTRKANSESPVVFYINTSPGDSVFMALYTVYSTGLDTRSWYWIQMK